MAVVACVGAGAAVVAWLATLASGGLFDADDVRAAIVPGTNVHWAPTTLLAVENTHNTSGGRVFPLAQLEAATAVAHEAGDALRSGAAQVQHAAHNAVDSAKHRIQDAEKNAEKYVANAADSLKELVVRHPVTSVAIAAGVGLLIGSLFLRARG